MARTLNAATAAQPTETDKQHNTAARQACIQKAFASIYAKKLDIDAEMEAHVNDLKEDLRKLWQGVKKDTGLNLMDLKLNYALYARDRDAEDLDDEAEREKIQDGLRAGFEALQKGEMVNFLEAIEAPAGNGKDATAKAKEAADLADATAAGKKAGAAGKSFTTCPHAEGSGLFKAWQAGWEEGQAPLREKVGRGKAVKH